MTPGSPEFERTHLNTVTPDALLMAAALIWSRTQFDHSARTMVDRAEDLCREVQRRYDVQAENDAAEAAILAGERGDEDAATADRLYREFSLRAILAWKIAQRHRLALIPIGDGWVVKPDGKNDERIEFAGVAHGAILEWARRHAPEDILSGGLDPRSDALDPMPTADLAAMAETLRKRGGA